MATTPQVLVFQEFETVPAAITDPLRPLILGPQAGLHRYTDPAERAGGLLGAYDPDADHGYAWPGKAAGSKVDLGYTRVFVKDAELTYLVDAVGSGGLVTPVASYRNRVRAAALVFATRNGVSRSAALGDRDVAVGDRVTLTGIGSDAEEHTLRTYVKGLAGDATAAAVAAAQAAAANHATQSYAVSVDKVAGADNTLQLTAYGTGYDGTLTGAVDEYYTILVTRGSTGGDLSTARLRVTSASGLDNAVDVQPAAVGGSFALGANGLLGEFDRTETSSASSEAVADGASPDDLVVGQSWRVRVRQTFVRPTATAGGTYTGSYDTTYIVRVTKGGPFGGAYDPEVTVATTTGVDAAGPVKVAAAATAVPVGNHGVTVEFDQAALRTGDEYTIAVTAAGEGAVRTLVLGHALPDALEAASDLRLELAIRKDLELTADRVGAAPLKNWEATATELTVYAGATAYDATWTAGGEPQPLELTGGTVYAHYREWLAAPVGVIGSVGDVGEVEGLLGTIDPDNPLAYGAAKAVANANGTAVRVVGVADPADDDAWADALAVVAGADDVYNLVPLTSRRSVIDLVAAHVEAQSGPEQKQWRGCFVQLTLDEAVPVVTAALSDDGGVVLARLVDDPLTSGTQYALLELTSGNVGFEAAGVRAGDTVRYLYQADAFGGTTYTEFTVDDVRSETAIRLATGHSVAVPLGQKVEIHRAPKKPELSAAVARQAGSYGSTRVCPVWPDRLPAGGVEVPGYYLCAALAGLRGGVVPHQGLTNVQVAGFDATPRSTEFFTRTQLDQIGNAGGWVVATDRNGVVHTRWAVTSDTSTLNAREEMIRANVDSISYTFARQLAPLVGKANVTPSALRQIETTARAVVEYLKANGFTQTLGSQLIDGTVREVRRHALLRDRVVVVVDLTVPAPLNVIELHLVVGG